MEESEVIELILSKTFQVAKTMPGIPHEYTVKRNWGADINKYDEVVDFINKKGYQQTFFGRQYTYFDIGRHQYWAMGIIINRAIKK